MSERALAEVIRTATSTFDAEEGIHVIHINDPESRFSGHFYTAGALLGAFKTILEHD